MTIHNPSISTECHCCGINERVYVTSNNTGYCLICGGFIELDEEELTIYD